MAGRIAYYGNIATQGLVLNLDAAIQGSYPKTGSTWFDISNNGNNGTLTNGPLYTGSNYGAIVFDGVNDTYTLGSFRIGTSSSFTISSWFKRNGAMNNKYLLKSGEGTGRIWFGVIDEANVYGTLWNNTYYGSGMDYWQRISNTFTSSQFTELVFTQDKSSLIQKSYLNGSETNSTTLSGSLNNNNESFGSTEINASISNLKIYNQSLSPFQVWQNFNAYKSRYGIPDIVTDGLVLNLDAGNPYSYLSGSSGTTWSNTVAVSSSISGTLVNGPVYSNGAITFDGVDDYGLISNTNLLTFGNNPFSISFWMKPINFSTNYRTVLSNYSDYNVDYISYFYCAIFNGGGAGFNRELTILDSAGNWTSGIPKVSLTDNEWVNIVITRTGNIVTIYKNTLPTVGAGSNTLNFSGTRSTKIFGGVSNISSTQGSLSNLQIYNKALSQTEVQQNFNALRGRYGI